MKQTDAPAAQDQLILQRKPAQPLHARSPADSNNIGQVKTVFADAEIPVAAQHNFAVLHGPVKR